MTQDITALFGAPSGAQIIIDNGEMVLVVAQREHRWRMTVEGHALGSQICVTDLPDRLASLGLTPHAAPVAPAPVTPAPEPPATPHACPECGKEFANKQRLGTHRFRSHGVRTAPAPVAAEPEPEPQPEPAETSTDAPKGMCEVCGTSWRIHERCSACGVGVGNGHIDMWLINGKCRSCVLAERTITQQVAA